MSARVAAATSFWRIKLSPTRNVEMPALASRVRSSGAKMPLSATTTCPAGTKAAKRSLVASVVSKVFRLRLLMPMQPRFQAQRSRQLLLIVDLDEHVHAERERRRFEVRRAGIIDRGHDDEDAIGAGDARFGHLIGVVHEILAQHRQRAGRARRAKMIERALERRRIGQHRQTRRAAGLIGGRQRRRIEFFPDQSLRGARLFDFGDQRIIAHRAPALDRRQESARRARRLGFAFERRQRAPALCRGDLFALIGGDVGENVSHRWRPRSAARAVLRLRRNLPRGRQARHPPSGSSLYPRPGARRPH